ncbi:mpv17-like protein 2 [Plakobranchus ocellatus]|uniref:Mpv17-like protein 2 n=1 Tax=Plakobranchus ocellatus TaxID=259542 RepID=A0AAV4ASS2_9GAST|nr:mpv17-like protein 2 [Plakobranchus ocellatus]
MGLLDGNSVAAVYEEWSQKFIHIYMVDWMFWPLAQFINFYLIPYRYRVFYVNFATFLWNTFLCYAKHHSDEVIKSLHSSSHVYTSIHNGKKNNAKSKSKRRRKSPAKSKSSVRKASRARCMYFRSSSPGSARSKLRYRLNASPRILKKFGQKLQSSAYGRRSIQSLRKRLPTPQTKFNYNESKTNVLLSRQASWESEDWTNCSASLASCRGSRKSDLSNQSSSTCTTISTSVRNTRIMSADNFPLLQVKVPAIKKLGLFAEAADVRKPPHSRVQTNPPRQKKPPTGAPQTMVKPARRGTLEKLDTGSVPSAGVAKKAWPCKPAGIVGPFPALSMRPLRINEQTLEDVKDAVRELKGTVVREQRQVRNALAEIQRQVSRLQELCTVTYSSVNDGAKDLALKANQLAHWVQEERKLEVQQIQAVLEQVLQTKLK